MGEEHEGRLASPSKCGAHGGTHQRREYGPIQSVLRAVGLDEGREDVQAPRPDAPANQSSEKLAVSHPKLKDGEDVM